MLMMLAVLLLAATCSCLDFVRDSAADAHDAGCWCLMFDWMGKLMPMMLAVLFGKALSFSARVGN